MMVERQSVRTMRRQALALLVRQTLVDEAGIERPADTIADDEVLGSAGLRVNSLAFIRTAISIEEQLNINFADELFMRADFGTVGDLVDLVYTAYQMCAQKQECEP